MNWKVAVSVGIADIPGQLASPAILGVQVSPATVAHQVFQAVQVSVDILATPVLSALKGRKAKLEALASAHQGSVAIAAGAVSVGFLASLVHQDIRGRLEPQGPPERKAKAVSVAIAATVAVQVSADIQVQSEPQGRLVKAVSPAIQAGRDSVGFQGHPALLDGAAFRGELGPPANQEHQDSVDIQAVPGSVGFQDGAELLASAGFLVRQGHKAFQVSVDIQVLPARQFQRLWLRSSFPTGCCRAVITR